MSGTAPDFSVRQEAHKAYGEGGAVTGNLSPGRKAWHSYTATGCMPGKWLSKVEREFGQPSFTLFSGVRVHAKSNLIRVEVLGEVNRG